MNGLGRWLATPLAGTAGVMAGLCLLAIPLRKLTSAQAITMDPVSHAPMGDADAKQKSAVLRLKLLSPAKGITITTVDQTVLLGPLHLDAGETEYDVMVPLRGDALELVMEIEFTDSTEDSAAFLTVMPDELEGQTRHVVGSGALSESLIYDWHTHSH